MAGRTVRQFNLRIGRGVDMLMIMKKGQEVPTCPWRGKAVNAGDLLLAAGRNNALAHFEKVLEEVARVGHAVTLPPFWTPLLCQGTSRDCHLQFRRFRDNAGNATLPFGPLPGTPTQLPARQRHQPRRARGNLRPGQTKRSPIVLPSSLQAAWDHEPDPGCGQSSGGTPQLAGPSDLSRPPFPEKPHTSEPGSARNSSRLFRSSGLFRPREVARLAEPFAYA